ncbi:C2H2 type zinc finger containing protein [Pseudozyma hubeiensis SY62]|uniref:C2H2 type zinc finger containing protein n=1 Tax=Pseudozyma hubeiensis (strain SY62) TaxID=1305764 RepID=R9P5V4_PSEHS|nr:C2H2 type zinc finger containing protein [Pseudozyma hubeiensis SY62]GAC96709.1 C2H2 type zinc finger containing protein [Pseudozyma hubeiensis SY62]
MRNEHLKAHQRRHRDASEKSFVCEHQDCALRFWTSSQLKNHVQACHADNMSSATEANAHDYPCTEDGCELTFHKRKQLRQHIRDHHCGPAVNVDGQQEQGHLQLLEAKALPFVCLYPGCGKRFATNSRRKTHFRTHEEGRYTCSMEHDLPQQHGDQDAGPFVYTFPNWTALQAHIKEAHPPICPWPGCGKRFQRQDNLKAHYRRHEDRKLRLEMEAKMLEGKHETERNQLRAELSDDSYASSSEDEQDEGLWRSTSDVAAQSSYQTMSLPNQDNQVSGQQASDAAVNNGGAEPAHRRFPALSEEQLVLKAAQLHSTRPRRGGVFRGLSSPTLSIVTSASDKTRSARLGSVATSIMSARNSPSAFACTWNGCSKVFTRKSTLSIHVRTAHLGERPFECLDCGRRFAHKHLVSRHRRVCSGITSSPDQGAMRRSRLRFSAADSHKQADEGEDLDEGGDSSHSSTANISEESDTATIPMPVTNSISATIKPRLLDLLTGQGYSGSRVESDTPTSGKRVAADDGNSMMKKRRITRDRIFACPWAKICSALDQQASESTSSVTDPAYPAPVAPATQSGEESTSSAAACEHRFKRLYDLRRHLRARHDLDLSSDELSAITHQTAWTNVH